MAVEQISEEQKAATEAANNDCQMGKDQADAQQIENNIKQATDMINQANQKLSKLPENTIANLEKAIKTLTSIINGQEDISNPEFDPDKIIEQIQQLLDPVVNNLIGVIESIGLPPIPGLGDISGMLDVLKKTKPPEKPEGWEGEWPKPGEKPEIPPEKKRLLRELLDAIQSLMITLPMVCVQILFKVVDLILGTQIPVVGLSFYSIIGMVPYVREVPQLVKLTPKIGDLITNAAGKIGTAVEGKMKQTWKAIEDLGIPEPPEETPIPEDYSVCPSCQNQELEAKEKESDEKKLDDTAKEKTSSENAE